MIIPNEGEVTFDPGEDLFNESKIQILTHKNKEKMIKISHQRKFLSYCYEFCGITGLSYPTLRFQSVGRDVKPDTILSDSCTITVTHKAEFSIGPPNSLKSSLKGMVIDGTYSDLKLKLSELDSMNVHKCILSCRSKKFDTMLEKAASSLNELDLIDHVNGKVEVFKTLINFLYSGEVEFPNDPMDVFLLLKLANEYSVSDLMELCEEDIIFKLNDENILDILITLEQAAIVSDSTLEKCRTMFVKNFESVCTKVPDIEERLFEVKGLIKNLLLHVGSTKRMKRKVTFMNFDVD